MDRFKIITGILFLIICLCITGCGKDNGSPVSPTGSDGNTFLTEEIDPHSAQNFEVITGLYDVFINSETLEVEIVPLRGPDFALNITRLLQPPAVPTSKITIALLPETEVMNGYIVCDITFTHPFPGTEFSCFDVKGIIMGETGVPCEWDSDLIYPGDDSVRIMNADGWTRWWNQVEFTSFETFFGYSESIISNHNFTSTNTLNPYKYFATELGATSTISEVTEAGRGFFSSQVPSTRRYELQFPILPQPIFHYKFAMSAHWAAPIPGAEPPWTVDDYNTEANQQEAFRIGIEDNGSTAYYTNASVYGGDLNLTLDISDWQLAFGGPVEGQINGIYLESPTLFDDVVNIFDAGAFSPGPDAVTVKIDAAIDGVTPTGIEDQYLIVHVTSTNPSTYAAPTAAYDYPEDAKLAAHLVWNVPISNVGPQEGVPVADASATDPVQGSAPFTVNLDPSNSYDTDGTITLYEWDFENDGTFDTSDTTPVIVPYIFSDPGHYEVNLRVTDNESLTDELDDPLVITVNPPGDPTSWSQYQASKEHVGDIYWETELHPPLTLDWSVNLTHDTTFVYIATGTPIIGDGYIMILYSGRDSIGYAEFFDFDTGTSMWDIPITGGPNNGPMSDQAGTYAGGLFYAPGDRIRCMNPATQEVVWTWPDPPASGDGPGTDAWSTTQCSLVYDAGKIIARLGLGPQGYKIVILDALTGELLDSMNVTDGRTWLPAAVRNDIAFIQGRTVVSNELYFGHVAAYDLNTGLKKWTFDTDNPPGSTGDSSMFCPMTVPGDGHVYFGCYNGYYYCLDEISGEQEWRVPINNTNQYNVESSAYWNGYLYYGEAGGSIISRLVCINAVDGGEEWSYSKDGALKWDEWTTSCPIVVNGVVYAGVMNSDDVGCEFVGCDALTGDLLFSRFAPHTGWGDPAAVNGRLVVLSSFQDRENFLHNPIEWAPVATLWCFKNIS